MSSNESQEGLKFKTVEDELKYWKQSSSTLSCKFSDLNQQYRTLWRKYEELLSCHICISKDSEEIEIPPAKRRKIVSNDDEKCMDPLKRLPEPMANKILKYLTGKELLNATEISKSWNDFIKVRGTLMDKVIFKPEKDTGGSLTLINEIMNNEKVRSYKHMRTRIVIQKKVTVKKIPILRYASTIETLKIEVDVFECEEITLPLCDFPKLRKMSYPLHDKSNFMDCSFPSLTHLRIDGWGMNPLDCFDVIEKFLQKLPKLKVLRIDGAFENKDQVLDEKDPAINQNQRIKAIRMNFYTTYLLKKYGKFLEKLELYHLTEGGLCEKGLCREFCNCEGGLFELLRDQKILKSLTVQIFHIEISKKFISNGSIETLKIFNVEGTSESDVKDTLLALPSLKLLVLYEDSITPSLLKFIAAKMRHLKKLICKVISRELRQAYREIQQNPHLYINTTFEFVAERDYNFEEIEEEFEKL